jgi:uncharacterized protein
MLLDLNRLHGPRQHVERTVQPSDLGSDDPDYVVAAPVELVMDVSKAGADTFEAVGRVKTRLELACGRCLEPFDLPVDATFELRYVPQPVAADAEAGPKGREIPEDREIDEDDLTVAYYSDGQLDIGALLREQFQLALPMKPLCSAACRGLCVQCGTNLNRTQCECAPAWDDPRLAPLKSLLNRPKEN